MATYDLDATKGLLSNYAQQRWGRSLNDQDYGRIGQAVGYQGGPIDDALLGRAHSSIDEYAHANRWEGDPFRTGDPTGSDTGVIPPSPQTPAGSGNGAVPPSTPTPPQPPAQGAPAGPDLQGILNGAGAPNPAQQAAQDALLRLLTGAQQAVTLNDPDLQPVSDAYRMTRQRGYERERNALAERGAATGAGPRAGGFNAQAIGALQGANRDTSLFNANLVQDKIEAQRQQLVQGIQMATEMGNAQAARDLQTRLALLNATMQQQQIDLQRSLGQGDLDLRRLLGFGGLDLNRELGRGDLDLRNRTLSQQGALGRGDLALRLIQTLLQNDQYYSGLGLNAAQLQALLNQNAVTQLLGGF